MGAAHYLEAFELVKRMEIPILKILRYGDGYPCSIGLNGAMRRFQLTTSDKQVKKHKIDEAICKETDERKRKQHTQGVGDKTRNYLKEDK